ncbi:hypothetical protein WJ59_17965 [Burkholderia gladioli]|uniref:2-oxoadipate dioxygenase/decarboxylase HglS n=1 Tax=Burkholderia gladioli TaxID=28095 RepID=UPI00075C0583|nr:VOC family protein [Burkholderia gladioli]KVM65518.1 hypothetical protein WJ59_17965 [Burkholderia gladioli]
MHSSFLAPHEIRTLFSTAMSEMYCQEVPQYSTLLELVGLVNERTLAAEPGLRRSLESRNELERLAVERHGAIRVGTPKELSTLRRIFAVMDMKPVGYYDLSVAGVPVHSTAFRPVGVDALAKNPFRVFTSLLRLELVQDAKLREEAQAILARRQVFTTRALELTERFESTGGLSASEAAEFVAEVLETFRWHGESTIDAATYKRLHDAHRLVADVVCFKGPHINHLTPRTLDIDAAQQEMLSRGLGAKDVIEGPPRRKHPILLRQTSFKALEETIVFQGQGDQAGSHTARFGEIEQRGMALTRKGRALYDRLLAKVRDVSDAGSSAPDYMRRLEQEFVEFPDDLPTIRAQGLAFFLFTLKDEAVFHRFTEWDLDALVSHGAVEATPIIYEDFLPVSAAGIFQSNLGGTEQKRYSTSAAQAAFEAELGDRVLDEIALYEQAQASSIEALKARFVAA